LPSNSRCKLEFEKENKLKAFEVNGWIKAMPVRKVENDGQRNTGEWRQATKRIRLRAKLQLIMTVRERKLAVTLVKGQTTLCQGSPTRKTRKTKSDGWRNTGERRQVIKRI
jgi:hypothetical protein